jgi:hypothetical protein
MMAASLAAGGRASVEDDPEKAAAYGMQVAGALRRELGEDSLSTLRKEMRLRDRRIFELEDLLASNNIEFPENLTQVEEQS